MYGGFARWTLPIEHNFKMLKNSLIKSYSDVYYS